MPSTLVLKFKMKFCKFLQTSYVKKKKKKKKIAEEVKESGESSLIVDETKDVLETEQISIELRYYHGGSVKENFLKFLPVDKLDTGSLTNMILSCLEKSGFDYKSNLVGQGP